MDAEQQKEQIIAEAKRLYYREYRKRNKERIKEINERYWLRQAEALELRCLDKAGEQ